MTEAGAWDGFHSRSTPLTPEQERVVAEAARLRQEVDRLVAPEGLEFGDDDWE